MRGLVGLAHPRWHCPAWATEKCGPGRTAINERGDSVLRAVPKMENFVVTQNIPTRFPIFERFQARAAWKPCPSRTGAPALRVSGNPLNLPSGSR